MTLLQLTSLILFIAVIWIGWREEVLASERQRKNYWRSKAEANDFYLSPQDFPTVVVPESDCVRIYTQQEGGQP